MWLAAGSNSSVGFGNLGHEPGLTRQGVGHYNQMQRLG